MANGGIIGPVNQTSFGKDTITTKTSSTPSAVTTQPGTRLIKTVIVAGGGGGGGGTSSCGGGGGSNGSVGGGAGGLRNLEIQTQGNTALGAVTIGAGGSGGAAPGSAGQNGTGGSDSSIVVCGTTYTASGGGYGQGRGCSGTADAGGSGGGAQAGVYTGGLEILPQLVLLKETMRVVHAPSGYSFWY
jgi:hypothetical protein